MAHRTNDWIARRTPAFAPGEERALGSRCRRIPPPNQRNSSGATLQKLETAGNSTLRRRHETPLRLSTRCERRAFGGIDPKQMHVIAFAQSRGSDFAALAEREFGGFRAPPAFAA